MQPLCEQGHWFTFYLLDGFALHGFSSATEVLRLANDVAGRVLYQWRVVSKDGKPVMSSCGMSIAADSALSNEREWPSKIEQPRMVVVCGGLALPPVDRALEAWLRMCRRSRVPLAGLVGGLYSLARTGLLDGRRCAVHWQHYPDFSERFFEAKACQTTFETDDSLYTCSGGSAAFDMFLGVASADFGQEVANRICEVALLDRVREAGERQRLPLQTRVGIDNALLIKIIERMEANLGEPWNLNEISLGIGLSRRQVERMFRREMGWSPARYYLNMRLERAHLLLVNSSLPVFEIAVACGFCSASHFSRTYRDTYGSTPQQTRIAAMERHRPAKPSSAERHRAAQESRVA
ncbi:GlxA family transcriptional regulator [Pararhizobium sp. YC-54]|uniref:GlxA family transcriptional regulator n=1 Tax=Pararhizobium sp. YC-54 TaxID=2986920 RepID=UPI0021F69DB7|nr:GlxA family transcriptional regulator [Pararhizobium sp. YC-54]MCW0000730.1 GlxA family transcriptional regulator [Pararhizobium sp. YC-54]